MSVQARSLSVTIGLHMHLLVCLFEDQLLNCMTPNIAGMLL